MSNELVQVNHTDTKTLQTREEHIGQSLLSKDNFGHYMQVATFLSKSSMVPKNMMNKPADVLIAMEMGLQLGLPMMQAIQDIAVINGKPCMYGDGLLAVVQGHKDFEWIKEEITQDEGDKKAALCTIKRKNHEPHTVPFTIESAKKASLWGKAGPWSQYPDRMLQMRARGFCIRDIFSDALRGIKTEEEVRDYTESDTISIHNPPAKIANSAKLVNKIYEAKGKVVEAEILEHDSGESASNEQLEDIHALLACKDFENGRLTKAMDHYKVETLSQLTSVQANDFISNLNKLADKE